MQSIIWGMCKSCVSVWHRSSKMSSGDALLHGMWPTSLHKVLDRYETLCALKHVAERAELVHPGKEKVKGDLTAALRQLMNSLWRSQGQTLLRGAKGKDSLQWRLTTAREILTR